MFDLDPTFGKPLIHILVLLQIEQDKLKDQNQDLQNYQNKDMTNLKRIIAFESKESINLRKETLERSETDILENGSFLNMCGNDSLVIGAEHDKYSQMESFER